MPWPKRFTLGGHRIGAGRAFVIAEAGVNHNGDLDLAHRLIEAAHAAKADAVKFQTFRPEDVVSAAAPKAAYQRATTSASESQLEMVRKLALDEAAHQALSRHARELGILFLSTPFDAASLELLERLGLPAYKIASGEVTNLPFLRAIAATGRPALLSTGMCDQAEVERAAAELNKAGAPALALFHCVSNYPADPADANLRAMATLAAAIPVPVGYSDHTPGIEISLAAVALGAALIEKHLTLDRNLPGPDHLASLEPAEFAQLVASIRRIEASLGDGIKAPRPAEADTRRIARRSLFLRAPVRAKQAISAETLIALRPGTGIGVEHFDAVAGRVAARDLAAGAMLAWTDLA